MVDQSSRLVPLPTTFLVNLHNLAFPKQDPWAHNQVDPWAFLHNFSNNVLSKFQEDASNLSEGRLPNKGNVLCKGVLPKALPVLPPPSQSLTPQL